MLLNSEDFHGLTHNVNLQVHSRLDQSTRAASSGRSQAMVAPPFSGVISSSRYDQSAEIDTLVQFQTQQLQSGMELLRRKHSREFLSMVEQQANKRLRVKEMGLEYVCKRNMELEEQVRQLAAEAQVWFDYARAREAEASSLRAKIEQVLTKQISIPAINLEEGYGDSGGDRFPSTDNAEEESAKENQIRRACVACKEKEVCVVLLPCRHLCVCKGCESIIETCPVCSSIRNASIDV